MKKIISIALAVVLTIIPCANATTSVYLTGVNDTIIEYKKDTEPYTIGGRLCVPYTVFSGLGISSSYNNTTKTLVLYNLDKIVTLDLLQGTIRDEKSNYYAGSAYLKSNIAFVPVDVICKIFGFEYSVLTSKTSTIRITNGYQKLSNEVFKSYADTSYDEVIKNISEGSTLGPEQPLKEIAMQKIYPIMVGEISKAIIDNFEQKTLTIFLDDTSFEDVESIVYASLNRQQFGIKIPSEICENYIETSNYIKSINNKLFQLTGEKTRLIFFENDENASREIEKDGYIIITEDFSTFSQSKIEASKLKESVVNLTTAKYSTTFIKYIGQMKLRIESIDKF